VPPYQGLAVIHGSSQGWYGGAVGDVAEGDASVPQQAGAAGPPERAVAESNAEGRLIEAEQLFQMRTGIEKLAVRL